MHAFPHHYRIEGTGTAEGGIAVSGTDVPELVTAAPVEFDGPGGHWSPETLLVAAVVSCFILTFRAIAQASKLPWAALTCSAEGLLDRVDGSTRFTRLALRARLRVRDAADADKAKRLLEKAERSCLITNSLSAERTLASEVEIA